MSGPPKPQHLSTVASTPKNDPLYCEAVTPEPGREARPIARELLVYPGFYSTDQLSSQVHKSLAAIGNGFSQRVPESALSYYIAATAYARLLKALDTSGRPITSEEDPFMRMIYAGNYNVPAIIVYFTDGLGNTKLNHREVRLLNLAII
jgi:hypothetical protein